MIGDKDPSRRSHASTKVGNLRGWKNLLAQFTPIQREIQAFFPINPTYFCVFADLDSCAKVSDNWETLLGWKREVLEAQPWIQWMDAPGVGEWRDQLQSLRRQGKTGDICRLQNRWRHIDGSWLMLSWRISFGADRQFYGVAQLSSDLPPPIDSLPEKSPPAPPGDLRPTDQRNDQNQWRSLIQNSGVLISIQNPDGTIVYVTPSVQDILGYQPQDLIGKTLWDLIDERDIARVQNSLNELLKTENQSIVIEYRCRHQNGCWRFLQSTMKNLLNEPSIQGILLNSHDITLAKQSEISWQQLNEELEIRVALRTAELKKLNQQLKAEISDRKQAQAELQAAEYQWRQMINKIADGVLILNRDGIVLFANSAAENLFNLPHEELLDLHFGIPNSAKEICEIYLPQKDGSYITVEMRTEQIEWQDQSVYLASLRNISDRQEAELRLRESEERYRTLAESSQDLIFILNSDRTLAYINSFGAELLGIEQPSTSDLEIEEISIIYQFKHLESSIKQVFSLNASVRVEDELVYQGGKLWLDTLLVPLRDNLGKISQILGVARDITQLKSIEQSLRKTQGQLRQREKLLRLTLEQAPIGIVTCDLEGNFLHFNPAFSQILGYSAQKLRQMSWENITDKDDLQIQENHYQKLLAGEVRNFQLENCYLRQDGNKIQGIIRVALIRDAKGSPMHYVAQLEDVTERKQAEAKIQASLKEKEVLLKEIHHRVKNNLQIVSSLLDLQAEYIQEPEILEKLEDSKHRLLAMSLIHETLYQSETLAQVDFSDYVERLATNILFAQSTDYERITLDFNLEPVFLNLETAIPCGLLLNELITNSIKHAFPEPRHGKIYIELHYQSKKTASNENQTSCQGDKIGDKIEDQIMLKVSDDGVGMPPNINLKETKSLGLTLIHDLTQQLRGNLAIDLSNGTEFILIFSELKYPQRI